LNLGSPKCVNYQLESFFRSLFSRAFQRLEECGL